MSADPYHLGKDSCKIPEIHPAVVDSLPAAVDSLPAAVDSLPAAADSLPAAVDSLPAAVDSLPAAVGSLPAAVEDSFPAAVVDSLPAAVEGSGAGSDMKEPATVLAATMKDDAFSIPDAALENRQTLKCRSECRIGFFLLSRRRICCTFWLPVWLRTGSRLLSPLGCLHCSLNIS